MARATGRGIWIGVAACLLLSGCSVVRRAAIHSVARSLAGGGEVWASDDDPQLVRDATPFALKTIESLLAEDPRDPDLLRAAARGFTEYAYAFVDTDARELEIKDYAAARAERERARRLYLRGRDYGLRGLEVSHPGIATALQQHPTQAVAACDRADVVLLYWSGAAWGGAVSVGKDHPELLADLPAVRALLERALALDEGFEHGAIHAALLPLDALSPAMGGSPERAARHYERALALSGGRDAGIYVTWAESVAVARQDRKGFDAALASALAIDPDAQPASRLANLVAQRRARTLKAREDELFLEEATP